MHSPYVEVAIMFHEKFLFFPFIYSLNHLFVAQIIPALDSRSYSCLASFSLERILAFHDSAEKLPPPRKKIHATISTPTELYLLPFQAMNFPITVHLNFTLCVYTLYTYHLSLWTISFLIIFYFIYSTQCLTCTKQELNKYFWNDHYSFFFSLGMPNILTRSHTEVGN